MTEVFMPKAGMDMQEGRLIRWLKQVGDPVEQDEPIMEIETDKITMEAEAPAGGILLARLVEDNTVVPVLQVIGYIGQAGEQIPQSGAQAQPEQMPTVPVRQAEPDAAAPVKPTEIAATPLAKTLAKEQGISLAEVTPSGRHGEVLARDVSAATPLARRIADDRGIDLSTVAGSGHAGKIMKEDVLAAQPTAAPAPAIEESRKPLAGMRKIIAQRMVKSHTETPVVTQHMKVYVEELLKLRMLINSGRSQKITVNDLMIKIVAQAVREHPAARTFLDGQELVVQSAVNIGFAVGMEEGLMVPVIKDADRLSLSAISAQAKGLAEKARGGGLKPDDVSGGCFTISNMGMYGVYAFTPIINQPEPGILGVCAVQEELTLVDETPQMRRYMMISLTFDHRIMDGTTAALFQGRIKELMEHPMEAIL